MPYKSGYDELISEPFNQHRGMYVFTLTKEAQYLQVESYNIPVDRVFLQTLIAIFNADCIEYIERLHEEGTTGQTTRRDIEIYNLQ